MERSKTIFLKWVDVSVILLFFSGILLLLFLSGTVNSGYHFQDDHEMIAIHTDLQTKSFIQTSANWIIKDLNIRFRPMYYIHRVFELKIFGLDFYLLSIYTGILAALTLSFFYLGARKLKYSILESIIFTLLIFVGPQMAIWWEVGLNETIGMFFLSLSFWSIANCREGKRFLINSICFIIFLSAASLSKESFVIIIPAFLLFRIWHLSRIFNVSFSEIIKKNLILIIPIVIMVSELWIIYFVVGTDKTGYAGPTSNVAELIKGIFAIVSNEEMLRSWFEIITIIMMIYFVNMFFTRSSQINNSIKRLYYPFLFLVLIVLPNIYLYAKSGMTTRYLLPSTLGFSFLIMYLIENIHYSYTRVISFIIITIFLIISFKTSVNSAIDFALDGRQINQVLPAIITNANPKSKILLVVDPVDQFEASYSLRIYLAYKGIDNLYAYPITREYNSDFERNLVRVWTDSFKFKTILDINGRPDEIFIFDKYQSDRFFHASGLRKSDYRNIIDNNNPHMVLVNNQINTE